ncbi:hypothetical protein IM793_13215 [Pedobacter sp. MR2016-19]|uniref:hypothetical protein n=1 Tax=Pedobacter sp. MR2016-19 TaxID=2780089 RepID=UPI001876217D|nr:hypothetical protein [Pedobacter sp. MR2016-19]MBE5320121.1 hypothetical protein [Pedobacter sp. MR2016-19]
MNKYPPQPLPLFFVSKAVLKNRVADYQKNKLPLLSKAIGKPETKSIWYTKDHIAKLLAEIEYVNGDGLRLYFGSYDAQHPSFAGQQCILMTVTREEFVGDSVRHINVFLEEQPGFEARISITREFSANDSSERNFNFGSPCPPACDESSLED